MTLPTEPRSTASPSPAKDKPLALFGDALRWLRQSLSGENLWAGLKTLSWLVPLTLLIWIYAEREQVDKIDGQSIPIEVRSSDPKNRFVELRMSDKNVIATLSGPRGRLDELLRQIEPRGDRASVIITVDPNLPPGQVHSLDTAQMLAGTQVFTASGVMVSNPKPDHLPVYVDEYMERELDVQPPPNVTNLVGAPIFEPRRITVRAPRKELTDALGAGPLVAYADLAGTGVIDKPGPHEVMARVYVPNLRQDNVVYNPSSVKATLEVRQADQRYTIPSIAVFVTGPRSLLEKYKVECQDTLPNVTVIGPPDQIALLQQENSPKPTAVLEVSSDDLPAGTLHTKRLRFLFPDRAEGVRISPEDAQRTIDYKLAEKGSDQ